MGAPIGNKNAKKKPWQDALRRALARKGGSFEKGMNLVADQIVEAAIKGDQWAIKEIGDRVDGKAAQQQIITGIDDGPVQIEESQRPKVSKEEWLKAHGVGTSAGTTK